MGRRLHPGPSGGSPGAGTHWCPIRVVWGQAQTGHPQPLGHPGAEQQREVNTLPEGPGHLALRRHQRHPWVPGEGWRGER